MLNRLVDVVETTSDRMVSSVVSNSQLVTTTFCRNADIVGEAAREVSVEVRQTISEFTRCGQSLTNTVNHCGRVFTDAAVNCSNSAVGLANHLATATTLVAPYVAAAGSDLSTASHWVGVSAACGIACALLPRLWSLFARPEVMVPHARGETINRTAILAGGLLSVLALVVGPFIGVQATNKLIRPMQDWLKNVPGATWVVSFIHKLLDGTATMDACPQHDIPNPDREGNVREYDYPPVSGVRVFTSAPDGFEGKRYVNCRFNGAHPNVCEDSCLAPVAEAIVDLKQDDTHTVQSSMAEFNSLCSTEEKVPDLPRRKAGVGAPDPTGTDAVVADMYECVPKAVKEAVQNRGGDYQKVSIAEAVHQIAGDKFPLITTAREKAVAIKYVHAFPTNSLFQKAEPMVPHGQNGVLLTPCDPAAPVSETTPVSIVREEETLPMPESGAAFEAFLESHEPNVPLYKRWYRMAKHFVNGSWEKFSPVLDSSVESIQSGARSVRAKLEEHPVAVKVAAVVVGALVAGMIGKQVFKATNSKVVTTAFEAGAGIATVSAVTDFVNQPRSSRIAPEARKSSRVVGQRITRRRMDHFQSEKTAEQLAEMWEDDQDAEDMLDAAFDDRYVGPRLSNTVGNNRRKMRPHGMNRDYAQFRNECVESSKTLPNVDEASKHEFEMQLAMLAPMSPDYAGSEVKPLPFKTVWDRIKNKMHTQDMLGAVNPFRSENMYGVYRLVQDVSTTQTNWLAHGCHIGNKVWVPTHSLTPGCEYRIVNASGSFLLKDFYPVTNDMSVCILNSAKAPRWRLRVPTKMENVIMLAFHEDLDKVVRVASGAASPNGYHRVPSRHGCCAAPLIDNDGYIIGFHIGGSATINAYVPVTSEMCRIQTLQTIGELQGLDFPLRRQMSSHSNAPGLSTLASFCKMFTHSGVSRFLGNGIYEPRTTLVGRFHEQVFENATHQKWLDPYMLVPVFTLARGAKMRNQRSRNFDLDEFELEYGSHEDIREVYGLAAPNLEASYRSVAKYARVRPALSDDKQVWAMNRAYTFLAAHFGPYLQDSEVISLEEAVATIDMTTSPGVVWSRTFRTKRDFFEKPIEGWSPLVWLAQDWERLRAEDYIAIFGNSVKEEMRLQEKLDRNSMRTFTAGPVEMTIHGNRLFWDQNQKFYDSALATSSTVGFCSLKGGWHEMIEKLNIFPNGYALDETEYDSSLFSSLLWMVAKFRFSMLLKPDTDPTGKSTLQRPTYEEYIDTKCRVQQFYKNIINTMISTMGGTVVMKNGGNPSGSSNTIVDNTFCLYLLLAYAWCMNAPEDQCTYPDFDENVRMLLCGDDNTWTVSDAAHPFYNARSVVEKWKALNVITTTDTYDPRPADQLDYLSAETIWLGNRAVPKYPIEKLMASLAYAKDHSPPVALAKAAALRMNGWTNLDFLTYINKYIQFLLKKYACLDNGDDVLCEQWRNAKKSLKTDSQMQVFYTGVDAQNVMHVQGRNSIWPQPMFDTPAYEEYCKCALPIKRRMSSRISRKKKVRVAGLAKSIRVARATGAAMAGAFDANKLMAQLKIAGRRPASRRKKNPARKVGRRKGAATRAMGGQFPMGGNRSMNKRTCTVVEDEYIGEVLGSVAFATTAYAIQPGIAATFPWLSRQAPQWERYKFNSLEFYYRPEVSAYATNGQSGKVILNADYDASDAPPTTKQQVEDSMPHADCMPYNSVSLKLNPKQLAEPGRKYVRAGPVPASTDIKLYDGGVLNVSTYGNQNTSAMGELHVRYSVTFEVPILDSTTSAFPNRSVSLFTTGSTSATSQSCGATGVATQALLANAAANGLGCVNTAGSVLVPAGNYLIDMTTNFNSTTNLNVYGNAILSKDGNPLETGICQVGTTATFDTGFVSTISYVSSAVPFALTLSVTAGYTGTSNFQSSLRIAAI